MSDPHRLFSAESGADELLRSALGSAHDDQPSAEDIARLSSQLAGVLPAGALSGALSGASTGAGSSAPQTGTATAPATSAASTSTAGLFSAKWIIGALVVGGIAGASIHAAVAPGAEPAARVVPATSASTIVPATSAAPVDTIPTLAVSSLPSASSPVTNVPPRTSPSSSAAPAAPPEPELLDRAHDALLHGNPAGALALAQQHARAYPQGVLAQERELIAIEALLALSRRDEARSRASAFRSAYPGSSHIARLDAMLGAP